MSLIGMVMKMSKAILLSIQPQHVVNILNGKKTIEIRKKFPKDFKGWVYIYCTKNGGDLRISLETIVFTWTFYSGSGNGKVVARFYVDNVEEIYKYVHYEPSVDVGVGVLPGFYQYAYYVDSLESNDYHMPSHFILLEKTCLEEIDLNSYFKQELEDDESFKVGYAIHISQLEIFDKPKELSEFERYLDFEYDKEHSACWKCKRFGSGCYSCHLSKAPKNYCYIEVEE